LGVAFLRRLLFYIIGIGLGALLVTAFFGDRDFDYAYGPQARVKKIFRTKAIDSTSLVQPVLDLSQDSIYFHAVTKGKVDFGASEPRHEPCGHYALEFEWDDKKYQLQLENCADTVRVLNLKAN
jgi:hypothetical protein